MSTTNANELRSSYLTNAARYLLQSSQSSSSHMMAENLELHDTTSTKIPQSKSMPVCMACGILSVPGLTTKQITRWKRQASLVTKSSKHRQAVMLTTELVEECLTCGRISSTALPSARTKRRTRTGIRGHSDVSIQAKPEKLEAGDTISMKRKRKKHATLLSKSSGKDTGKTTAGFDLMDFMKAV